MLDMNHPLRCRCGTLKGHVSHPENATRLVCYCKDCQAFAHFLGAADDVLDAAGGTSIVATLPKRVTFTEGVEFLACMSLTKTGLLRWYAKCCNTPIGNTPRGFKTSYVGLVHTCLADPSSFGPIRMRANTKSAKGPLPTLRTNTVAAIFRVLRSMIRARLNGDYQHTPFFVADSGTPVVPPKVLSSAERERVMNAL